MRPGAPLQQIPADFLTPYLFGHAPSHLRIELPVVWGIPIVRLYRGRVEGSGRPAVPPG
jgi:hypothetical protein